MANYQVIFGDGGGNLQVALTLRNVTKVTEKEKALVMRIGKTKVFLIKRSLWGYQKLEEQEPEDVLDQFDDLKDELVEKLEGGEQDANMAQDSSRDTDNLHSGSVVDMLSKRSFKVCR